MGRLEKNGDRGVKKEGVNGVKGSHVITFAGNEKVDV
jgi:hypothetical protein